VTYQIIVQRLTDYVWLAVSRALDDEQVLRVGRILWALRLGLAELKDYYENSLQEVTVPNDQLHPRFFPSTTSLSVNGSDFHFKYLQPLQLEPSCVTFLARRHDSQGKIVVKFVRRYNLNAHQYMADLNLAPKLVHHALVGPNYGDLCIVVMEYVKGQTMSDIYHRDMVPAKAKNAVQNAIKVLNKGGWIFGDLKRQNVMLASNDGPVEGRIRLIDFDWVCKDKERRYPFHLSSTVCNLSGAQEFDWIEKKHQDNMLSMF
jgi:serine/threonine protein kinase